LTSAAKRVKDDWDYLDDMIAAGETILVYSKGGKARFMESPMAQDAIIHRFEVMGEAAKRVSQKFRENHPAVPWRSISAFRDRLSHGDDQLELDRVWAAVGQPLKNALAELRRLRGD
jgi:uncharacterized protein with HEPN domain